MCVCTLVHMEVWGQLVSLQESFLPTLSSCGLQWQNSSCRDWCLPKPTFRPLTSLPDVGLPTGYLVKGCAKYKVWNSRRAEGACHSSLTLVTCLPCSLRHLVQIQAACAQLLLIQWSLLHDDLWDAVLIWQVSRTRPAMWCLPSTKVISPYLQGVENLLTQKAQSQSILRASLF